MEISTMVLDLGKKIEAIEKENKSLMTLRDELAGRLATVNASLQANLDDLEAFKMAYEALGMVGTKKKPEQKKPDPTEILPKATPVDVSTMPAAPKQNLRKAKNVLKCDARGNQIGFYRSLSECAKDHRFGVQTLINMIEKGDRASMLANRGYYFTYAT